MNKKEDRNEMRAILDWFAPYRTFFALEKAETKIDTLREAARDHCYAG